MTGTSIAETKATRKIAIKKEFLASCQNSSAETGRSVFKSIKSAITGTSVATDPTRRIAISPPATADNSGAKMHFVSPHAGDAMDIRIAPTGQTRRIVRPFHAPIINSTALRVEKTEHQNVSTKANSAMGSQIALTGQMRSTLAPTVCARLLGASLNAEARLKEALVPVQLARKWAMTRDLVSIEMNAKNGISATRSAKILTGRLNVPASRVTSSKIAPTAKPSCPIPR